MTQAKSGDKVKVHYTGKLSNGRVFDSTVDREPLQFTLGEGKIISGFEQAVIGMNPGESKNVCISSDQAYGPHRKDLVAEINRSEFPASLTPKVGQQLQFYQPNGQTLRVIVTEVNESTVTLDGNHPLAGEELTFNIKLLEIVSS